MLSYVLETKGLTKLFPGVIAMNSIDMRFESGKVHGIVGENGAGKSTLIKTLGGVFAPDAGEILLNGKPVKFKNAGHALSMGVSVVFQELSLVPTLTVAENIFANRIPRTKSGLIDWNRLWKEGQEMLDLFGLDTITPRTKLHALSTANQQMIEILKGVSSNPKVLILDEPTSSLTELETQKLFGLIKKLGADGCTVIYISHHLQEIFRICDNVSVFKDGCHVCDAKVADIDETFLIGKMVGREIKSMYGERSNDRQIPAEPIIRIENLSSEGLFRDVSFAVYQGQITTLAGLVGAGRTEICRGIFGAVPISSGKIYFKGQERAIRSTRDAIKLGIAYMTENRKMDGLYLENDISFNLMAGQLAQRARYGFLHETDTADICDDIIRKYSIVCTGRTQRAGTLSGGNQQKVLLAECVEKRPELLIIDEPTKGIDVGAKSEVYNILHKLAKEGMAILLVSSDLPETLKISDRIIVMRSGRVAGELTAEEATEETVMKLMVGTPSKSA